MLRVNGGTVRQVRGRAATVVLAVAALGVGCAEEADSGGDSDAQGKKRTARLSKADVPKGRWPLTVSEGVVRCEGSGGIGSVIFRTAEGEDYGVNGTALSRGLPGIEPIWKKDPAVPGTRINISPVLDRGLKLCE